MNSKNSWSAQKIDAPHCQSSNCRQFNGREHCRGRQTSTVARDGWKKGVRLGNSEETQILPKQMPIVETLAVEGANRRIGTMFSRTQTTTRNRSARRETGSRPTRYLAVSS
jgi:hypothetical protein